MKIAVVGTGLIGGSIGARRARAAGRHGGGRRSRPVGRPGGGCDRHRRAARAGPARRDGRVRGRTGRRAGRDGGRRAGLRARRLLVTDAGSVKRAVVAAAEDERFVGGHPLAGAETGGRGRGARGPLRRRHLVPDAHPSQLRHPSRAAASPAGRPRRSPRGASTPRPTTASWPPSRTCPRAGQRAGRAGAGGASAVRPSAAAIGPSFRDATRVAGANPALWAGIYAANADALGSSSTPRSRG